MINNLNDYHYRIALKNKISIVANAMQKMQADNLSFWDNYKTFVQEPELFKNYFKIKSNFIVQNPGSGSLIYYDAEFQPFYTAANTPRRKGLNGKASNDIWQLITSTASVSFQLEDGSLMAFVYSSYWYGAMVLVDTNGPAAPNKITKDIWMIPIRRNAVNQMIIKTDAKDNTNDSSSCSKTGSGWECINYIMKDINYKIPAKKP